MSIPHFSSYEELVLFAERRGAPRGGRGGFRGQRAGGPARGGGPGRGRGQSTQTSGNNSRGLGAIGEGVSQNGQKQKAPERPLNNAPNAGGSSSQPNNKKKQKKKGKKGKAKGGTEIDDYDELDELPEFDFNDLAGMDKMFGVAPKPEPEPLEVLIKEVPKQYMPPHQRREYTTRQTNNNAPSARGNGRYNSQGGASAPLSTNGPAFSQPGPSRHPYSRTNDTSIYERSYTQPPPPGRFAQPGRRQPRGRGRGGIGSLHDFAPVTIADYDNHGRGTKEEDYREQRFIRKLRGENTFLQPINFVKSTTVLFNDQEEIFKAEIIDTDLQHEEPAKPESESESSADDTTDGNPRAQTPQQHPPVPPVAGPSHEEFVEGNSGDIILLPIRRQQSTTIVQVDSTLGSSTPQNGSSVLTSTALTSIQSSPDHQPQSTSTPPGQPKAALPPSKTTTVTVNAFVQGRVTKQQKGRQTSGSGKIKNAKKTLTRSQLTKKPAFKGSDMDWESTSTDDDQPANANSSKGKGREQSQWPLVEDDDDDPGMDVDTYVDQAAYSSFVTQLADSLAQNHDTVDTTSSSSDSDGDIPIVDDDGDEDWEDEPSSDESDSSDDSDDDALEVPASVRKTFEKKWGPSATKPKGKSKATNGAIISGKHIEDIGDAKLGFLLPPDDDEMTPDRQEKAERVQALLAANQDIMTGRTHRKERNKLLRTIQDEGLLDDDILLQCASRRRKPSEHQDYLPPELLAQWEWDRLQKRENKRKRAEARRAAMQNEHSGQKGKKLKIHISDIEMQSAKPKHQGNPKKISKKSKKDEPDNEGLDPKTIEAIFWEFIDDDEDMELQLPPMSRESRKGMHEIAGILGLKSLSFGIGASRATTLSKIPKKMNQRRGNRAQVRELFERWAKTVVAGEEWVDSKTKGKKKKEAGGSARGTKGRKHKEGDIVGQHAAKIDEANVGYQLLQAMGWTEGARIGASGGLEAPLKAVFKSTRLGLGHF